jgi:hypothetical protein
VIHIDFHVHSCYSFDSLLKPGSIIKTAKKRGLSGIAVTDHDTIRGGVETLKLAKDEEDFVVIVGAEIKTNIGDLIGIFLEQEIKSREFFKVVNEIKQQGGIVILPHPYRTFDSLDSLDGEVIDSIDLIEGFNARVKSNVLNLKAREFALKAGKPIAGGSDAHFAHEIGNGRTLFNNIPLQQDAIRAALLGGKVEVRGDILPFPLYVLYVFGIGRALRFIKSHKR